MGSIPVCSSADNCRPSFAYCIRSCFFSLNACNIVFIILYRYVICQILFANPSFCRLHAWACYGRKSNTVLLLLGIGRNLLCSFDSFLERKRGSQEGRDEGICGDKRWGCFIAFSYIHSLFCSWRNQLFCPSQQSALVFPKSPYRLWSSCFHRSYGKICPSASSRVAPRCNGRPYNRFSTNSCSYHGQCWCVFDCETLPSLSVKCLLIIFGSTIGLLSSFVGGLGALGAD